MWEEGDDEEEEDLSPQDKLTLPFAGDGIQPPLTRRETSRDEGRTRREHAEILRSQDYLRAMGAVV